MPITSRRARFFVVAFPVVVASEDARAEWSFSANDPRSTASKIPQHDQLMPQGSQAIPTQQPLEFIHITKTGGTAVELSGAVAGIRWGVCHYGTVDRGAGRGCFSPDWDPAAYALPPTMREGAEHWHTPPRWLVPNPYEGLDTFAVVRNPYERLISEYYCHTIVGYKGSNAESPQTFNRWLTKKLNYVEGRTKGAGLWDNGHFIPQHYYIYDKKDNQIVTHILRYENLQADFDNLMVHYNLPSRLTPKDEVDSHEKYALTVRDISVENIEKTNKVYDRDFSLLGYNKIETNRAMQPLLRALAK